MRTGLEIMAVLTCAIRQQASDNSLTQLRQVPRLEHINLKSTATHNMGYRDDVAEWAVVQYRAAMDRQGPFDFYLDRYVQQIVSGYTNETLTFGLRVFMRDFNKVGRTNNANTSR